MLRTFHALPTEERARGMRERDYLWCALNLMLDDEEALDRLCPSCRSEAERGLCPACGGVVLPPVGEVNSSFDWAKYRALGGGEGQ